MVFFKRSSKPTSTSSAPSTTNPTARRSKMSSFTRSRFGRHKTMPTTGPTDTSTSRPWPEDLISNTRYTDPTDRYGDPDETLAGFYGNPNLGAKLVQAAQLIDNIPDLPETTADGTVLLDADGTVKQKYTTEMTTALNSLRSGVDRLLPESHLRALNCNSDTWNGLWYDAKINKQAFNCSVSDMYRRAYKVQSQMATDQLNLTRDPDWETGKTPEEVESVMQWRSTYADLGNIIKAATESLGDAMTSLGPSPYIRRQTGSWGKTLAETEDTRLSEFSIICKQMRPVCAGILASEYAREDLGRWGTVTRLNSMLNTDHPLQFVDKNDPIYSARGLAYPVTTERTVNGVTSVHTEMHEKSPERLMYEGYSEIVKKMNGADWTKGETPEESTVQKQVAPRLKELHVYTARFDELLSQLEQPKPPTTPPPPPRSWLGWASDTLLGPKMSAYEQQQEFASKLQEIRQLVQQNNLTAADEVAQVDTFTGSQELLKTYYKGQDDRQAYGDAYNWLDGEIASRKASTSPTDICRDPHCAGYNTSCYNSHYAQTGSTYPTHPPPTFKESERMQLSRLPPDTATTGVGIINNPCTDPHCLSLILSNFNNSTSPCYQTDQYSRHPLTGLSHPPHVPPSMALSQQQRSQCPSNPASVYAHYTQQSMPPPTSNVPPSTPQTAFPPKVTQGYATTAVDHYTATGAMSRQASSVATEKPYAEKRRNWLSRRT